jgi:hypothetical protein
VRGASFRRLRGVTALAVIASEAAFWYSDETSANADTEILNAIRPALATTRGPLIVISSPYGRKGEVWEIYRRNYGPAGDPRILVVQGSSREFNPILPQSVVDRALERDRAAASAEYLAEFRTDIESFVNLDAVSACIERGVRERPPVSGVRYVGHLDPSGGAVDSMAMAIAHLDGERAVLDVVREVKAPFRPDQVAAEFSALFKQYRVREVRSDRYGSEWVTEAFRKHDITVKPSEFTSSELFIELLPLINSRQVVLLDNDRVTSRWSVSSVVPVEADAIQLVTRRGFMTMWRCRSPVPAKPQACSRAAAGCALASRATAEAAESIGSTKKANALAG